MDLVIYGAQGLALGVYQVIHNLLPSRVVRCFLVTEQGINAKILAGVPVLELIPFAQSLSAEEKDKIEILIATPEDVMPEIERNLEIQGLYCHVRMTSLRWSELMKYRVCDKKYIPLSALPVGYHKAAVFLFMAKFYKDRQLTDQYNFPGWVIPIQVGAALCCERVADMLDCNGDNISDKNGNYSELTALYWIWKNQLMKEPVKDNAEYYGLCHYRRILELSDDDVLRLIDNDIDVVLPFPMPYEPNIEEHHKRYINDQDWKILMTVLKELHPESLQEIYKILSQQYLYNYNIMIARKFVLNDYCQWLFPILERVEELSVPKGKDRNDRYIGYMGETLATIYFAEKKEQLNIVHTGCRFLN